MNKLCKGFNIIQFVNWTICCIAILYFFLANSPGWFLALEIGIGIQFLLFGINWRLGTKRLSRWAIYDCVLVVLILLVELETHSSIRTGLFRGPSGMNNVFLFLLGMNALFFFSIYHIVKEYEALRSLN